VDRAQAINSQLITEADTNKHVFASQPGMYVVFSAGTNTSPVTIMGAGSTGGISLASGVTTMPIGPIQNLNQFAYQFGHSGDTLGVLVLS
jgi:hypothetical protein